MRLNQFDTACEAIKQIHDETEPTYYRDVAECLGNPNPNWTLEERIAVIEALLSVYFNALASRL